MRSDVPRRRSIPTASAIAVGAIAVLALHVFAPPGAITWSYAHLDRSPVLPALAGLSMLALPAGAAWLWGRAWVAVVAGVVGQALQAVSLAVD